MLNGRPCQLVDSAAEGDSDQSVLVNGFAENYSGVLRVGESREASKHASFSVT